MRSEGSHLANVTEKDLTLYFAFFKAKLFIFAISGRFMPSAHILISKNENENRENRLKYFGRG